MLVVVGAVEPDVQKQAEGTTKHAFQFQFQPLHF